MHQGAQENEFNAFLFTALKDYSLPVTGFFSLSASRSGRFYLPSRVLSIRLRLTGKLTGKPKDNRRFSKKTMESEVRNELGSDFHGH
jgi:hypothetical protein